MSNGATDVLFHSILLAGTNLVRTKWDKKFLIWISEKDQSLIGSGIVGLDITKIGWTKEEFIEQKKFILDTLTSALNDKIWNDLPYNPSEEIIMNVLSGTLNLFSNLSEEHISSEKPYWYCEPDINDLDQVCEIHGIYMNRLSLNQRENCQLCKSYS